ncbi:MAG: type II 3-dehydroquinate dehydratase [Bacteroidetes bacterium 43-16]|nr:MAG: type II 3-dehydroquinate dehydratase [Bacteroidetes bacterium 43-16]
MRIKIINGPNLNMLGKRQPEIYGTLSFEAYFATLEASFPAHELHYFQSNHEGALIDAIQELMEGGYDGLVINPAAYTHTSIAIADALAMLPVPIVEVHISNIYEREAFRQHSYVAPLALATIAGKGLEGYKMALELILNSTTNGCLPA